MTSANRQKRTRIIFLVLIVIVSSQIARNPHMQEMRLVDQLQLISLGALIGLGLHSFFRGLLGKSDS